MPNQTTYKRSMKTTLEQRLVYKLIDRENSWIKGVQKEESVLSAIFGGLTILAFAAVAFMFAAVW